ncbi:probable GTP-binding protein EngB [Montipora foliosa]|uniref:probable GTP-binding protein EngB n=1 Tax=Montipora foliosa TaxID=591990 RepID=UPI0035F1C199
MFHLPEFHREKALFLLLWRFFYHKGSPRAKESQSVFNPTSGILARADKEFQLLGPKAVFQGSAVKTEEAPNLKLPEVAFIGRTSVGKSSLINALLNQTKLVKTSKTPGHTRLVNFYNIGSKFYLVDLPGYGYVQGVGKEQGTRHFVKVAEKYLKQRAGKELRSICLLIDGKVGVTKNDMIAFEMMGELDAPFQVVLTKMDKLHKGRHQVMIDEVYRVRERFKLNSCFPHIFPVSAKGKTGLSELRYFICLSVGFTKPFTNIL